MREIKFRGKRIDNGELVYGYVLKTIENRVFIVTETFLDQEPFSLDIKYFEVKPQTIGQYTGLQDKNGKEAYEGDIVVFLDGSNTENGFDDFYNSGDVEWCDETAGFQITNRVSVETYEVWEECEVIGNIHDNEEWLGE